MFYNKFIMRLRNSNDERRQINLVAVYKKHQSLEKRPSCRWEHKYSYVRLIIVTVTGHPVTASNKFSVSLSEDVKYMRGVDVSI